MLVTFLRKYMHNCVWWDKHLTLQQLLIYMCLGQQRGTAKIALHAPEGVQHVELEIFGFHNAACAHKLSLGMKLQRLSTELLSDLCIGGNKRARLEGWQATFGKSKALGFTA